MKTIYKYDLLHTNTKLKLPTGAEVLAVKWFKDKFNLWAKVDINAELEERLFVLVGTGWNIDEYPPAHFEYIDTVIVGDYVWHVHEAIQE